MPVKRNARKGKKAGFKLPIWGWLAIVGIVTLFVVYQARTGSVPQKPVSTQAQLTPAYTPQSLTEITEVERQEIQAYIDTVTKNQTGCILIRRVLLRADIYGMANWNEDHRPCADVQIIIPTRVKSQAFRMAVVRKELKIIPVLQWAFGQTGVPEVKQGSQFAQQYNVLFDGLSVTLLPDEDQRLILPDNIEPIHWDGVSYPSEEILDWLDQLSASGHIFTGGVAPYHR